MTPLQPRALPTLLFLWSFFTPSAQSYRKPSAYAEVCPLAPRKLSESQNHTDAKAGFCSIAKQFSMGQWLIDPSSKGEEILELFIDSSQGSRMPHGLCCNNLHCTLSGTELCPSTALTGTPLAPQAGAGLQPPGSQRSTIIFIDVTLQCSQRMSFSGPY